MLEVYQRTNGVYTPKVLDMSDYSLLPHCKNQNRIGGN